MLIAVPPPLPLVTVIFTEGIANAVPSRRGVILLHLIGWNIRQPAEGGKRAKGVQWKLSNGLGVVKFAWWATRCGDAVICL